MDGCFIDGLRRLLALQIVPASEGLLREGWLLYSVRPDKEWTLTDCISFALMTRLHIEQAFTSDHHFA